MSDTQMPDGVNLKSQSNTSQDDSIFEEIVKNNKSTKKILDDLLDNSDSLVTSKKKEDVDRAETKKKKKKKEQEEKQEKKIFFEKTQESLKQNIEGLKTNLGESFKSSTALITEPFEKIFGVDLLGVMKSFGQDIFGLKKKGKKNPTEEQVAKIGKEGTGFLYLGNLFKKIFGKDKKKDGMMSGLGKLLGIGGGAGLGGIITKLLPKVAGALGIGAIIAGVIWAIIDGVKGFFKADEWGVSKGAGIAGSVLGGTGSGLKNAFKNAGKLALIGGGIGLTVGGPIGALVGGLIGAVLGGVLGFFGGKKIAKGIDKVSKVITEKIIPFVVKLIKGYINLYIGAFNLIKTGVGNIKSLVFETVIPAISNFFSSIFSKLNETIEAGGIAGNLIKAVMFPFDMVIKTFEIFQEFFKDPKEFVTSIYQSFTDTITGFFESITSIFTAIKDVGIIDLAKSLLPGGPSFADLIQGAIEERKVNSQGPGYSMGPGINDGIVTKTGEVIQTHPDDNILATKKEIVVGNGSSDYDMASLSKAISFLANKIAMLEPKIMQNTSIVKSFAGMDELKSFR